MKRILFCLLLFWAFTANAQVYNNEWIDFSKTYYKFKVKETGVYRIPQSTLSAAGLGGTPAEQFQLWRNGTQVPLYTSSAAGSLPSGGYIEFWGEINDGKPDKELYRNPDYQLNDKWNLITDTSMYFLTVNTSGGNLRLATTPNNVSGNTLPAEPYFMNTIGTYYRERLNGGIYEFVDGQYLFTSSYDQNEGFSSNLILANGVKSATHSNLQVYTAGPASTFSITLFGHALNRRSYLAKINGTSVTTGRVDSFNYVRTSANFATSLLSSNAATVAVTNVCETAGCPTDWMLVSKYEITYPMKFNFGGAANFEFTLPASATGKYLEISGFSYGSTAPVLYDLTNGKSYTTDVSAAPLVRVVLQPSATARRLVLVSEDPTNIRTVSSFYETRNFVNYSLAANQGDYMIISHPALFSGPSGNPVEDYRAYRSSAVGGGYNAKIYLSEELIDQFGFGIKKNPLGIRNFIRFARNKFATAPKNIFLLGKGLNYLDERSFQNTPESEKLNLIPTWGSPASDNLLSAEPGSSVAETPIGRLSAINGQEITDYLDKVKAQELAQATLSSNIEDKAWMKNIVHLIGISEPSLLQISKAYMTKHENTVRDSLFGANVYTFSKSITGTTTQVTDVSFADLMNKGTSLVTYFGHSATGTLEFNLDNPEAYNNTGKYPMMAALGCNAGSIYSYDVKRFLVKEGLSEKYVLAQDKGVIGFIASSNFGVVPYLNLWATSFYKALGVTHYGKTIGEILKTTSLNALNFSLEDDLLARANVEQNQLHGDPAVRLNTHQKVDYAITDSMLKITPQFISAAEQSFKVKVKWVNLGKTTGKEMVVRIVRQFPDSTTKIVSNYTVVSTHLEDSVSIDLPINIAKDKGINKIMVTIDALNGVDEYFETNNTASKEFEIYNDEVRPISPYAFSIVNQQDVKLLASVANPLGSSMAYQMEMDTTELFNSPLKIAQSITSSGGVLEFTPGITMTDSTVYYWRVAPVPSSGNPVWNTSSFIFKTAQETGFNQSHLYQHLKSQGTNISIDSTSRAWKYGPVVNNLFIKNAVWITATTQEGDLVVNVNHASYIRTTCYYGLIFNVFDKNTFKPWRNAVVSGKGLYESLPPTCGESRMYNFEFTNDTAGRRKAKDFLRQIPDGNFVVVRNQPSYQESFNQYVSTWMNDATYYGAGNTLYSELKNNNVTIIDSFYKPRVFAAVYQKNTSGFTTAQSTSNGVYDKLSLNVDVRTPSPVGTIVSPVIGPAKSWNQLSWDGTSLESNSKDEPVVAVVGLSVTGETDTLLNSITLDQKVVDLSWVDVRQYPMLQLVMYNNDTAKTTPYQLQYWKVTYDPAPEGAVAPNIYFTMKDTVVAGEPVNFDVAFKNLSATPFDSLLVKMVVTGDDNVPHVLPSFRVRPLAANDTLHIRYDGGISDVFGNCTFSLEVNPANDQPEQFHFNNFINKPVVICSNKPWYRDADGDGYGNASQSINGCLQPLGYVVNNTDCDDTKASVHPGATEIVGNGIDDDCDGQTDESGLITFYKDYDKDGYGNNNVTTTGTTAPAGYVARGGDCNDTKKTIYPGAPELCDNLDNDCDGVKDDGLALTTFYKDYDRDTYGSNTVTVQACIAPAGYITRGGDCNDAKNTVYPGATEISDNLDNDCDGQVDEGLTMTTFFKDYDKDGYGNNNTTVLASVAPTGYVATGGDCNDTKKTVYPGAPELCDNLDNDCDGQIDEGLTLTTFYKDYDKDGYGNNSTTVLTCIAPTGYVAVGGDCNDTKNTVYPGAPELCDNLDNDCDGQVDEGFTLTTFYKDYDKDGYGSNTVTVQACIVPTGYVSISGDCNDTKSAIHPGATEIVNGIDDNCNGVVDEAMSVSVQGTAIEETLEGGLKVKAMPNPSAHIFNLTIQSTSDQPVQIRVFNVVGNLVEAKNNIAANASYKIGTHYSPGTYMVEVVQGAERYIVKLVKL